MAFYLFFEIFLSTILCEANVSVRTWTSSAWAPRWDPRLTMRMTSSAPLPPSRPTPPAPAANGAAGRPGSAAPPPTEGPPRKRGPTGRCVFKGLWKVSFQLKRVTFFWKRDDRFPFLALLLSGSSLLPRLVKWSKFFNHFFSFQVSHSGGHLTHRCCQCGEDEEGGKDGLHLWIGWGVSSAKSLFWIREIGWLSCRRLDNSVSKALGRLCSHILKITLTKSRQKCGS